MPDLELGIFVSCNQFRAFQIALLTARQIIVQGVAGSDQVLLT